MVKRLAQTEMLDMEPEDLSSFSPDNSPGMRARLEAIAAHPRRKPINELGQEMPDPTPLAPPVGYTPQPTLRETIQAMVRSEHLRLAAEEAGVESFEEADDFDVGDDAEYDPHSEWEEDFEPLPPGELTRRRQEEFVRNHPDNQPKPTPPAPPAQKEAPEAPPPQPVPPVAP